jgi:FkbM family methyltransferase
VRDVDSILGRFSVWDHDHLGNVLASGVFWDEQIRPYLDEGDPSGWAIDVGASVGFLTRYMLKRYQGVVAVEANPLTFDLLALNVPAAYLVKGVAYDRRTSFEQAPDALLGWPASPLEACPNVSSIAFVRSFSPMAPLKGVVLDDLLDQWELGPRFSLVKVDAQGCDLRALRGLRRTIRRDRPLVLFEFEEAASSWHGDDWDDYLQFFAREHYHITRIREDLWDYVAHPE